MWPNAEVQADQGRSSGEREGEGKARNLKGDWSHPTHPSPIALKQVRVHICGPKIVNFELWIMDNGMYIVDCGSWIVYFGF